mgnify:CR=1 FL=1
MLLYRPGDFFVKHTDSLKSPRHLLTMSVVVALSGCGKATGDVQFPTLSTTWQGRAGGDWCAWYTSEEHAVTPLTGDGHRVVATYIVEELPVDTVEVTGDGNLELRTGNGEVDKDRNLAEETHKAAVACCAVCPFLSSEAFATLMLTGCPPFDSHRLCRPQVAEYLSTLLQQQGSFILFLKHAYSPRVFPETPASARTATAVSNEGGGTVTMPIWQLRGGDMEMFRLVQEALADVKGATYEVRDVSVVRCGLNDVGPLPLTRCFFSEVTTASADEVRVDEDKNRCRGRYFDPNYEAALSCMWTVPLKITPLPSVQRDVAAASLASCGPEDVNFQLEKVLTRFHRMDAGATVVYMQGWASPRNVSHVGEFCGNEGMYPIDWYRQAALIVTTLPQRDHDRKRPRT